MERERAEALARAYAQAFPRQGYWVEPVSWLEPSPTRPRVVVAPVARRWVLDKRP
jgi:hypothetical protein